MGGVESTPPAEKPQPVGEQWPSIAPKPVDQSTRATAGGTQLSQRSVITTVPPGVSPSALVNDASTTKTSDPSSKSSGKWSTQATNGYHTEEYSPVAGNISNSQIPDTQPVVIPASQETTDDSPWVHSQAHGLGLGAGSSPTSSQMQHGYSSKSSSGPKSHPATQLGDSIEPDESSGQHSSSSQERYVYQEAGVRSFMEEMTKRTSGCTVEQLEQVNRELMDEIWKSRAEWNRAKVLIHLKGVFNSTIRDIEQMQGVLEQSQESDKL
jgi:hypothetical protein